MLTRKLILNSINDFRNHNFNIERAKEAATLLEGTHDFRTFMNVSNEDRTVNCYKYTQN